MNALVVDDCDDGDDGGDNYDDDDDDGYVGDPHPDVDHNDDDYDDDDLDRARDIRLMDKKKAATH